MITLRSIFYTLNFSGFFFFSSLAWAQHISSGESQGAQPWQMGFQTPVTPVMQHIYELHHLLLVIISIVALFVTLLLGYVIFRFHQKRNPIPSPTTHNTLLEIVWTAIPAIILIMIGIPSLKLLYFMDKAADAELTVKIVGHQWYWSYEYPDHNIAFDSVMIDTKDLKAGQKRLLEVDRRVLVPIDTPVRLLLTSDDVIHSWAVPALGVKKDTVPGRLNETWFKITKRGVYHGQCSEICGVNHGFMPIVVEAVSKEEFLQWLEKNKKLAFTLEDKRKSGFL